MARKRRNGEFQPDHESFGRFVMSNQAAKPVLQVTRIIAKAAAAATPRSDKAHQHVADSYEVDGIVVTDVGDPPGPRRAAEITNSAPAAVRNEFGTERMAANRSLRKAAAPFHDPKVSRG